MSIVPKEANESLIVILKADDYAGAFNLNIMEKALILEASLLYNDHRLKMSRKIGMHERNLYRRIIAHGLENSLDKATATKLLDQIKSDYPLIFISDLEFNKMFSK